MSFQQYILKKVEKFPLALSSILNLSTKFINQLPKLKAMTGKDENPTNYNAVTEYLTENFKDMDIALQVSTISSKY